MPAIPYMPLYIADYLADAAHLSTLEHGAYLLLIMNYWQRGKALPSSNERLANVARMSNECWTDVEPTLREFFTEENGFWIHKRIEAELSKFRNKSEAASRAGQASAQRRFNGRSTDVQRTFNHTDTDTDTDTEEKNTPIVPLTGDVEVKVSLVPKVAQEFEEDWQHFWVKVGKGSARKAYLTARKKISREELITAVKGHGPQILNRAQSQSITPIHPATWLNQERWTDEAQALVVSARASPPSRKEQARIDFEKRLLEEMNERGYVLGSGS